jgi:hypothetical protein
MRISREGNLVTLINVFETKPEQQQELLTSAQRTPLQSATADFVAQPVGARMVLSTNTARSFELLTPWSVELFIDHRRRFAKKL